MVLHLFGAITVGMVLLGLFFLPSGVNCLPPPHEVVRRWIQTASPKC